MGMYRLAKVVNRSTGKREDLSLEKIYDIADENFKAGETLVLKDLFGNIYKSEIKSLELETVRGKKYVLVTTKLRDYYLAGLTRKTDGDRG